MDRTSFESWLKKYGTAWRDRNPHAAADLYTEDGTYQVTPFVQPMCGRQAIFEYWSQVVRTQENIQFGHEVLAVTTDAGIARWWASFVIVPQGLQTKLDGIFLISLAADGRCLSLREWWHKDQY
jgi:uncharacterized protein (TIGR02246 family)